METVTMSANGSSTQSASVSAENSAALPSNVMAALGYFCGIAAILALVLDPYRSDRKARFHAIQALLFSGTCFLSYLGVAIVVGILSMMAKLILGSLGLYAMLGVLLAIPAFLYGMLSLGMFGTWVYLMVRSAMGHKVTLPVIGPMADKMSAGQTASKA